MPLYTKQRDNFRCGPIAILNALRWAGKRVSYEYVYELAERCGCNPGAGTKHWNFDKVLRKEGKGLFRVHRIDSPYLWFIEEHAKQDDKAAIFSYKWRRQGKQARHFYLLDSVNEDGRFFFTVNDETGKGAALRGFTRKEFVEDNLRFQRVDPHYRGWFLSLE
jgi:hypothetical protein